MNEKAGQLIEDLQWLTTPLPGQENALPWTWILAAIAGLLILVSFFFLRWRKKKKGFAFIAPPAPHVQALAALGALDSLLKEGSEREFIEAVSRIARVYIQARFGLRAPHRSTEEFLWEAGQSRLLSQEHQDLLARFLLQCDLVKFARRGLVVDEMNLLLEAARRFVNSTVPEKPKPGSPTTGTTAPTPTPSRN